MPPKQTTKKTSAVSKGTAAPVQPPFMPMMAPASGPPATSSQGTQPPTPSPDHVERLETNPNVAGSATIRRSSKQVQLQEDSDDDWVDTPPTASNSAPAPNPSDSRANQADPWASYEVIPLVAGDVELAMTILDSTEAGREKWGIRMKGGLQSTCPPEPQPERHWSDDMPFTRHHSSDDIPPVPEFVNLTNLHPPHPHTLRDNASPTATHQAVSPLGFQPIPAMTQPITTQATVHISDKIESHQMRETTNTAFDDHARLLKLIEQSQKPFKNLKNSLDLDSQQLLSEIYHQLEKEFLNHHPSKKVENRNLIWQLNLERLSFTAGKPFQESSNEDIAKIDETLSYRAVDVSKLIHSSAWNSVLSKPKKKIKLSELPLIEIKLPDVIEEIAIVSWKWDITNEIEKEHFFQQESSNLIIAIEQAMKWNIKYLLIDAVSIDQFTKTMNNQLLIKYLHLYGKLKVITTFDSLQCPSPSENCLSYPSRAWLILESSYYLNNPKVTLETLLCFHHHHHRHHESLIFNFYTTVKSFTSDRYSEDSLWYGITKEELSIPITMTDQFKNLNQFTYIYKICQSIANQEDIVSRLDDLILMNIGKLYSIPLGLYIIELTKVLPIDYKTYVYFVSLMLLVTPRNISQNESIPINAEFILTLMDIFRRSLLKYFPIKSFFGRLDNLKEQCIGMEVILNPEQNIHLLLCIESDEDGSWGYKDNELIANKMNEKIFIKCLIHFIRGCVRHCEKNGRIDECRMSIEDFDWYFCPALIFKNETK